MTELAYAKSRATRDMKYRVYKWGPSPQNIFLIHDGQFYRRRLWKDGKAFGWGKWEVALP